MHGGRLGETQRAAGDATPGCLRAAARTYRRAFSTAASAMPSHTADHTECDTGSIVADEISA